jgi:hypothetical protein
MGTIPLGFNPANQTSSKGKKNPWDLNPTKFLIISYESKEALYYIK